MRLYLFDELTGTRIDVPGKRTVSTIKSGSRRGKRTFPDELADILPSSWIVSFQVSITENTNSY